MHEMSLIADDLRQMLIDAEDAVKEGHRRVKLHMDKAEEYAKKVNEAIDKRDELRSAMAKLGINPTDD